MCFIAGEYSKFMWTNNEHSSGYVFVDKCPLFTHAAVPVPGAAAGSAPRSQWLALHIFLIPHLEGVPGVSVVVSRVNCSSGIMFYPLRISFEKRGCATCISLKRMKNELDEYIIIEQQL